MRAQEVLLAVELEEGGAGLRSDFSAHTPTGIEQQRGQEDRHLDAVPLGAVKDGDRAAQLHVVTRRWIALDGVDQSEGFDLGEYASNDARFLRLYPQPHLRTAIEQRLRLREVVTIEQILRAHFFKRDQPLVA